VLAAVKGDCAKHGAKSAEPRMPLAATAGSQRKGSHNAALRKPLRTVFDFGKDERWWQPLLTSLLIAHIPK
jgi:hypothetical protein